jgi:aspartyl protease family protein
MIRFFLFVFISLALPVFADPSIYVEGLFKNTAIVKIDGRQVVLKVGEPARQGVVLIEANTKRAIVEINGERQTLTLSRLIGSTYNPVEKREVAIRRDLMNQYITTATINGRRVQVLVDTGANVVAISSVDARELDIQYLEGEKGMATTAGGRVPAYSIMLRSIDVGGITVSRVRAMVIEGSFPSQVLLGVSYLEHVSLREENGVMYMQSKY